MSVYNEPVDYIRQSIDSILNQTVKNISLIIIIDDPSNFDAIDYIKRISIKDNRVEYYVNDVNKGLVFSLNRALSYVKTKYVARMDADDISLPNRLEQEFKFLKKGKYDLVGCNLNDIDEFGKTAKKITVFPESNDKQLKYLKCRNSMAHPSWLGKTEVFRTLNGYRDIAACEDYDFLVRAAINGYRLGVCQKVLLWYRINPNGISSTKKAIQKTSLHIIRKYYRDRKIIPLQEYNKFINEDEGKNKYNDYRAYYEQKGNLNLYRKRKFLYVINALKILITSSIARSNLLDSIYIKLI